MGARYTHQDRLFLQAKDEGLRSRATYKIEELDKKYRLISKGMHVLDLGCAPGGWTGFIAGKVGRDGLVVGVDLEPTAPFSPNELDNCACKPIVIVGDATEEDIQSQIKGHAVNGYDLIVSDMSPKLSGIKDRDTARSVELVEMAFNIARKLLRQGGSLVAKAFPSPEVDSCIRNLSSEYLKIQRVYLKSSRKTSKELYVLAQDYKGFRDEAR